MTRVAAAIFVQSTVAAGRLFQLWLVPLVGQSAGFQFLKKLPNAHAGNRHAPIFAGADSDADQVSIQIDDWSPALNTTQGRVVFEKRGKTLSRSWVGFAGQIQARIPSAHPVG